MGFSTFTGPLRSGPTYWGVAANQTAGLATLTRSNTLLFSDTTAKTLFYLPAGAQIIEFIIDVSVEFNGDTNNVLTVETGAGADLATVTGTGAVLAVGRQTTVVVAAQIGTYINVGTADIEIQGHYAGTGTVATTGTATVTCVYVQRAKNGSQIPTT